MNFAKTNPYKRLRGTLSSSFSIISICSFLESFEIDENTVTIDDHDILGHGCFGVTYSG